MQLPEEPEPRVFKPSVPRPCVRGRIVLLRRVCLHVLDLQERSDLSQADYLRRPGGPEPGDWTGTRHRDNMSHRPTKELQLVPEQGQ